MIIPIVHCHVIQRNEITRRKIETIIDFRIQTIFVIVFYELIFNNNMYLSY